MHGSESERDRNDKRTLTLCHAYALQPIDEIRVAPVPSSLVLRHDAMRTSGVGTQTEPPTPPPRPALR